MLLQSTPDNSFLIILAILAGIVFAGLLVTLFLIARASRLQGNKTVSPEIESPGSAEVSPLLEDLILPMPEPVQEDPPCAAGSPSNAVVYLADTSLQSQEKTGSRVAVLGAALLTALLMVVLALVIIAPFNVFLTTRVLFPIRFFGAVLGVWLGGQAGKHWLGLQKPQINNAAFLCALVLICMAWVTPMLVGDIFIALSPFFGVLLLPWIAGVRKLTGSDAQTWNWVLSFIVASAIAYPGYQRMLGILAPPLPLPMILYWLGKGLALVSPACLAIAWLRARNVPWRAALVMIPCMPMGLVIFEVLNRYPYVFAN
jgi:hypothetical protein